MGSFAETVTANIKFLTSSTLKFAKKVKRDFMCVTVFIWTGAYLTLPHKNDSFQTKKSHFLSGRVGDVTAEFRRMQLISPKIRWPFLWLSNLKKRFQCFGCGKFCASSFNDGKSSSVNNIPPTGIFFNLHLKIFNFNGAGMKHYPPHRRETELAHSTNNLSFRVGKFLKWIGSAFNQAFRVTVLVGRELFQSKRSRHFFLQVSSLISGQSLYIFFCASDIIFIACSACFHCFSFSFSLLVQK